MIYYNININMLLKKIFILKLFVITKQFYFNKIWIKFNNYINWIYKFFTKFKIEKLFLRTIYLLIFSFLENVLKANFKHFIFKKY